MWSLQEIVLLGIFLLDLEPWVTANDMLYSWCETLYTGKITVVNGTRITDLCVLNKPESGQFHQVKLIIAFTLLGFITILLLFVLLLWISIQIKRHRQYRRHRGLLELVDYSALDISDV